MNKLLQRQLLKYIGTLDVPENFSDLFQVISESYDHSEKDRKLIELSIELSSKEMIDLNNELKNEKKELKTLFENIDEVFYSVDMISYQLTQISAACKKIYGYSPAEFLADGDLWQTIIHPDDKYLQEQQHQTLLKGKQVLNQYRIIHKDGSIRWIENKIVPTLDESWLLMKIDGVTSEITERKKAEDQIKESELRYRSLIEQAIDAICIVDASMKIIDINPTGCQMLGYSKDEFLQLTMADLFLIEDLIANPFKTEELKSGKIIRNERRLKRKDGTIIEVEVSGKQLDDGKYFVFAHDITEKKLADEEIIKSNQRYQYVTKATFDAIWDWDIVSDKIYWGEGYIQLFGEIDSDLSDTKKVLKRLHPEDIDKILASASIALEGKVLNWDYEHRYLKSDGSYAYVSNKAIIVRGDKDKVIRVIGAMQDITERKKTEAHIRDSEKRYRNLFEQNIAGFYQSNILGEIINCNEAFAKMLKYDSRAELLNINASELYFSPEERTDFIRDLEGQKKLLNYEGVLKCKDGSSLYFLENTSEQTDPVTGIKFFDGIIIDISDKKLAEQSIINSEEKRRLIMNAALDAIICIDTKGDVSFWNPQAENIFGWKENEVMGKRLSNLIIPEQFCKRHDEGFANYLKTGKGVALNVLLELSAVNRNGEAFPIELTVLPIKQDGEEFFCAFIRDITERKMAENTIQAAYHEKNIILESIADAFFAVDKNWVVTYWNKVAEKILHTPKDEIVGHHLWEVFADSIDSVSYKKYHQAIETNQALSFEDYYQSIDKWFEISASPSITGLSVYFKDITERKTSEIAIKKAYEEKNTVLESIDDGFFALDKDSIVTYWNKSAEILLDTKKEDLIGKNLHEVFVTRGSRIFYDNYEKALREKITINFEGFSNLSQKWFAVSAYGSDKGLSVYFKDVTEQKKAEEHIRLSNERYDMVTKATNDSIWDWNIITGKTLRTGGGFKTLFGYEIEKADKDELFWTKLVHPDDLPRVKEIHTQLFNNPEAYFWEDEYRIRKANGQYAWVYDKGYIIRDENGKATRMIGATQDITQQKEQVNEITRIQRNLDSLINTTTDLIWSVDRDHRIIAANKAFSNTIQKVTKKPVVEGDNVLFPDFGQEIMDKWLALYKRALSGEIFSIEDSTYHAEKKEILYNIISFSPIINARGKVSGVACYAKDVTELKKSGDKLQELNSELNKRAEELAESNTELERFAYIASHDLQEPLRMVSSFLQLLEKKYKDQLDETASKYIHFAVDGAERMKQLVLDLLEYSRVTSNTDAIGDTDMNEVMLEILANLKNKIEESGAKIEWTNLPVLLNTSKTQMLQLLQNLIGNGLKYQDSDKPVIKIGVTDEKKQWVFSVKDNGIGIDSRFADKVFIIFQRLHNKSEYSGTGIGLSICKKIVERNGGRIWVESNPDGGSIFYFSIKKSV